MIEENVKLYDCMKRSEKQFIVEVSAILTWDMATSIDWHLQVKELACDTFKHRFKVKSLPREKAVVQQFLMVRKTNRTGIACVQSHRYIFSSHSPFFFLFSLPFPTLCFSLSPLPILSSLLSLYFFSFFSSLSLPKNGTQLNVVQPVQLDPASQWMHRRTADSFLSRMEQRKKTWAVRVLEGEEGEPPAAKQQRIAQSEGQNKKKPPESKIIRNSVLCLLFSI